MNTKVEIIVTTEDSEKMEHEHRIEALSIESAIEQLGKLENWLNGLEAKAELREEEE